MRKAVHAATIQILLTDGYERLTISDVAREAGVHPTTIYRRWNTKGALALDAVMVTSATDVPAPDSGSLRGDLGQLVNAVAAALRNPQIRELARTLVGLTEPGIEEARRKYWQSRFEIVATIIDHAVQRGELSPEVKPWEIVERATAPIWMRALMTDLPFDEDFVNGLVDDAVDFALEKSSAGA